MLCLFSGFFFLRALFSENENGRSGALLAKAAATEWSSFRCSANRRSSDLLVCRLLLLRCQYHPAESLPSPPLSSLGGAADDELLLAPEVLQNSIKIGCNTRLKGVRVLPHKTELNMDFALGLNGVSV